MERYAHGGDIFTGAPVRLDFSVNLNPYGMPEGVKAALREKIDTFQSYPDPACRALRAALGQTLGISPDRILCGNGADDLIYRLCFALRPRRVLVCAPTFSEYEKAALAAGAKMEYHMLQLGEDFRLTERILEDIGRETDLIFLCTPNNPTGRTIPLPLVEKIAEKAETVGAYLMLDECFIDFTDAPTALPLQGKYPHLLILRAFTKLYAMAGLRLGYLIAPEREILARMQAIAPCWSVSAPAQTAGIAALECPETAQNLRRLIARERPRVAGALRDMGLTVWESECAFLLFRAPDDLGEKLRARGIAIRDCANYPGLGRGYWRIGLKKEEENDSLLTAIKEALFPWQRQS